jgi:hypothetical protein
VTGRATASALERRLPVCPGCETPDCATYSCEALRSLTDRDVLAALADGRRVVTSIPRRNGRASLLKALMEQYR